MVIKAASNYIKMNEYIRYIWYMVSALPFMNFYDILCARILVNYMAMPRTVEILTSTAVLGKLV